MVVERLNILVIGGGPGGYSAAIRAAQLGAQVTLIEKSELGGTCLNRGCIPTKTLLQSATMLYQLKMYPQYGIEVDKVRLDFSNVVKRKDDVIKNLLNGLNGIIKSNGIKLIKGTAYFIDHRTVCVAETKELIRADRIIIATGSIPMKISIHGSNLPGVITSDEILLLDHLPKSMMIIGGGVVGLEFAQIFSRMGTKVAVIEILSQILPNEDTEMANLLESFLKKEGIKIYTNTEVKSIEERGTNKAVIFDKNEELVEVVLMAVGRRPYTEGLGIDKIGIKEGKGGVLLVDDYLETNVSGIFAVGDVIGNFMLAHVAMIEGERAAENAMGGRIKMSYKAVPRALYTSPELASVGLTEKQAEEKYGGEIKIGKFPFYANSKALIMGESNGMVKIIGDNKYDQVLGVHIVGPHATELIGEATLGIELESTFDEFANSMHAHPSLSECIKECALEANKRAIHLPVSWKK